MATHPRVVFLKALVTSPKIVVGDYTYYDDPDDPARPIRYRFSDQDIHRLRRAAWWNWPADLINQHCRTLMTGTPAEIERIAIENGLERAL
ncbi:hypothetical protein [Micromonospora sp. NPDC049891]|uniref:hypothetical protein n=1 Tax=Micromonospora sp. NPDC049891 TaxID=3155655 RepID=UPI00340F05A2